MSRLVTFIALLVVLFLGFNSYPSILAESDMDTLSKIPCIGCEKCKKDSNSECCKCPKCGEKCDCTKGKCTCEKCGYKFDCKDNNNCEGCKRCKGNCKVK